MKRALAVFCLAATLFAGLAEAADFRDFPAQIYSGPARLPDFKGAQRDHAMFRTRIGNAARRVAPEFAGSWVVEQIGCGTGCTFAVVVDHRTGKIVDLPVGGETHLYMRLYHRPTSRLMKVTWIANPYENEICMIGEWSFDDGQFQVISINPHYPLGDCEN